jgi:alpha/beta superfamily hydrolase
VASTQGAGGSPLALEVNEPAAARGVAVLLHPHPHYGGNRFHPFIGGLFRRLPELGVGAIRFDFSSAGPSEARAEALAAVDLGAEQWPRLPVAIVGYSFGAGVAARISDERLAGWYLLAPQSSSLSEATIGADPRPKAIVVPEHDQFSPPAAVEVAVEGWVATTVETAPGADHFLGDVGPLVEAAATWIDRLFGG